MIKKIFPIIPLTFVNVIGFTLLIPILPSVIAKYAPANQIPVIFGVIITFYTLTQFISTPILGSLSDRYGRKPILLLCQLGTFISWIIFGVSYFFSGVTLFGLALPLVIISFSRIIDGITGGNMSVAYAWISDVTHHRERMKAFGIISAVYGTASLFGPVLGGISASTRIGYLGTAITACIVSFITLVLIYFTLSESSKETIHENKLQWNIWNELNLKNKFKQFNHLSFVKNLLIMRLFFSIVYAAYTTIIILYIQNNFHFSAVMIGTTLSIISFFSLFNQIALVNFISKRFEGIHILYLSIMAVFIGLILLVLIPFNVEFEKINMSYILFLIDAYILSLGASLAIPTFKSLLTRSVDKTKLGAITGLEESMFALGKALTPVLAGLFYSLLGNYTFYIYAFILLIPQVYIYYKEKRIILVPNTSK